MNIINVCEVGPRDGLQSIDRMMPLKAKQAWIKAEFEAGVKEIEVGSFVSPKMLPQMSETTEVVKFAKTLEGLEICVLVPNLKGAEMAIEAGVHKIGLPLSVSEEHSIRNLNRNHQKVLSEIQSIASLIKTLPIDERPYFEVGLSTAFGCSIAGPIDLSIVIELGEAALSAGADELGLADTTGSANPRDIKERVRALRSAVGADKLQTLHLHNTRGLGLANALAGIEEGITTLDASLCGLGGCPTAPGASGNIVTEDLVYMLEAMGLKTGINIDQLVKVKNILSEALPGEPLYGFIGNAGIPKGQII
ncbi:MAG: hydroxymethylglutaryl-CoA lyase [Pseudomonadota bacterium]|jgi:hydroxymethylglutaryl-CoA lyase|nr:hydroxymethylglutaryl-CoA lyase [Pseudomonadota bacterium]